MWYTKSQSFFYLQYASFPTELVLCAPRKSVGWTYPGSFLFAFCCLSLSAWTWSMVILTKYFPSCARRRFCSLKCHDFIKVDADWTQAPSLLRLYLVLRLQLLQIKIVRQERGASWTRRGEVEPGTTGTINQGGMLAPLLCVIVSSKERLWRLLGFLVLKKIGRGAL